MDKKKTSTFVFLYIIGSVIIVCIGLFNLTKPAPGSGGDRGIPLSTESANLYWDTRYYMSGYPSADDTDFFDTLLDIISGYERRMPCTIYTFKQGSTLHKPIINPINPLRKAKSYQGWDDWSSTRSRNGFPGTFRDWKDQESIPNQIIKNLRWDEKSEIQDALEILVTNTWRDISDSPENDTDEPKGVKAGIRSLTEKAENYALVYINLPWNAQYGDIIHKHECASDIKVPLYILIMGNKKRVFDFCEELVYGMLTVKGFQPQDIGWALKYYEYDTPLYALAANGPGDQSQEGVLSLDVAFWPKYYSTGFPAGYEVVSLEQAKITQESCVNLHIQDEGLQYTRALKTDNFDDTATANLQVRYRTKTENLPSVLANLKLGTSITYEIYRNDEMIEKGPIELYDCTPDHNNNTLTIPIQLNSELFFNKERAHKVLIRISTTVQRGDSAFIQSLEAFDPEKDPENPGLYAWNWHQWYRPWLTYGIYDLFVDENGGLANFDSNQECCVQTITMSFYVKGWG